MYLFQLLFFDFGFKKYTCEPVFGEMANKMSVNNYKYKFLAGSMW